MSTSSASGFSMPIAIVGSACRFPGASSTPSKLFDLLKEPRDVRREFNPEILNLKRFYDSNPDAPGSTSVKNKGYLLAEDTRLFDAAFFNVSPYEAESMDPQLRNMLETTYEAFESAGYTLDHLRGSKTSVHIWRRSPLYAGTGVARSILSNRISYTFDLHGPSVTLDTACSSSLVALHNAVQGLQAGDATCAVVGGVNIILDPMLYVMLSKLHMLSPDSQSRMWDKTVNGYARGEGAAVVVLKPLDQAIRDNDHIEAIIRGTGVNSDGQSAGLTVPTVAAQAELIRETYHRAGLDPIKDRCQYFECHGTGTPAGDPVESRAIYEAMIRDRDSGPSAPLYVGSIKTLIGHLEGGAGLAGVLKALLSIKHKTIFPNLLFNDLNPVIAPYYDGFQIPTSALPWPELPSGIPLRVSVNSFGFGGTNAHAILESHEPQGRNGLIVATQPSGAHLNPFVLSGHSPSALLGNAQALLKYLIDHPLAHLRDLSWALQSRRTAHRVRTFFTAQTHQELIEDLEKFLSQHRKSAKKDEVGIRYRLADKKPRVLGVFTGQGAQWPTMGRSLLERSPLFRRVLEECDDVLHVLSDGPDWSLIEELSKDSSSSRVGEALISQPLCTAIQLGLVEVLNASGVHFDTVLGHSSGEIAAVYSCGMIDAAAAMQIAYYRGKYAHLAHGTNQQAGGMIAVGISQEDAQLFCQQPGYQDRIGVAASNSPQSVTLSGDLQAIEQAKEHFDQEKIFARQLKVDTAYHSYHMELCSEDYLKALRACDIRVQPPKSSCLWLSSVDGNTELLQGDLESLKGPYWVQNMLQTVLFCPAVTYAPQTGGSFDLAIEVGPHPTLRGPTLQTLELASGATPPYLGTLKRNSSDVDALGEMVGALWCHLGPDCVSFDGFQRAFMSGDDFGTPKLLKDLPPYAWDHDRIYWSESRISANYRKNVDSRHPLLGRRVSDDTDREMRWRNILTVKELPWTQGHFISGEVLLPGTSYVSLSCEAARLIAGGKPIRRIELEDIKIRRPVIVPDTREGLETVFTVCLKDSVDPKFICGEFSYHYSDPHLGSMSYAGGGRMTIHLDEGSEHELPPYAAPRPGLHPIDSEDGYDTFAQNGFMYTGAFRRLEDVQRRLDYSVATAEWSADELMGRYTLHPAVLDVSWQNLFHARADPRAGKLPTAILPVGIKRVVVNPHVQLTDVETLSIRTESFITARNGAGIVGDVHIYSSSGKAAVQMESVSVEPVAPPTEEQDRKMFFDIIYKADPSLCLTEPTHDLKRAQHVKELSTDIERAVLFYVRGVLEGLTPSDRSGLLWYHKRLIESFESSVKLIAEGRHPLAEKSWLADGPEILDMIMTKWSGSVDLECIRRVGEHMLEYLKKRTSLLEVLMKDDLATRLYSEGCGLADVNGGMAGVLEQIAHKFPQARYIEIGAGTGSTTDYILRAVGNAFYTYTFTDISPAFFGDAADRFGDFRDKTIFKTLDVEKDVGPQGFQKHAYDVVVASNVLHATAHIKDTLKNARSLLKPGGFLFLVEITGTKMMRTTFCVGGLSGWWLGAGEGRRIHPGLTTEEWHSALQETGFSGVDLAFHDIPDSTQHCMSLMVTQAANDTIQVLREPLEYIDEIPEVKSLLIVGGKSLAVSKTVNSIQRLVGRSWGGRTTLSSDLESIDFSRVGSQADVIFLQELDNTLFSESITPTRVKALQTMVVSARNVLWLTTKRRTDSPHSNMMVGMARAISKELPHVNIQFLDLDSFTSPSSTARTILETFLRLKAVSAHDHDESPILWPVERELVVEGSDTLVPRARPDQKLNDRYNSRYRSMRKPMSNVNAPIGLTRQRNKLALTESVLEPLLGAIWSLLVRVQYSLSIPNGQGQALYLSVGRVIDSNMPILAVSESNTSTISIAKENVAFIDEKDCSLEVLERVADQIMLIGLLSSAQKGHSALIYHPRAGLAASFSDEARRFGLHPLCASSRSPIQLDWISIHPHSSVRAVQRLIPQNISVYLDCSAASTSESPTIQSALPAGCSIHRWDTLKVAYETLSGCLASPTNGNALESEIEVLNIENIASADASILDQPYIISWETAQPLSLLVQPLDTSILFDRAKTYLMIGMAGGLGISVCEWALRHGAKHLFITSRKPDIHPEWLAQTKRLGAKVHVQAMDAADQTSLEFTISVIRETLPPIGGVCNAAMVLTDRLFVDLDVDAMVDTFRPKVDVAKYLNDILADTPLDFFIMLSSNLAITGGQGSGNYAAANMFMTGLAAQRRLSGRPASVIHIGYVADVGYFTRVDKSSREYAGRMHYAPLSETDIHHAFGEAILAGRPNSERSCEIGVGIEPLEEGQEPVWSSDPLWSHYLPQIQVHDKKDGPQYGRDNIKTQIQDAETEAEVGTVIQEALCNKIETTLQLSAGGVDRDVLLTELGIDSLVAVEIRGWFAKNIGIDVPVVKILGRSSVSQICTDAAREIMSTKVETPPRNVDPEGGTSSESRKSSESNSDEASQSGDVTPPSTDNELETPEHDNVKIDHEAEKEQEQVSSVVVAEPVADFGKNIIHTERMSAAQSRIYVLSSLMNDPTAYSLMIRYDIDDNLDIDRLRNALTTTMQYHECLRTCFFARREDNQPTQGVLSFPVRRFKHLPNATENDIDQELEAARTKVWDIEHGETLSLTVLSRDSRSHTLVLGYHHIILDASGMRRFIRDLNAAYNMQPLKPSGGTCIEFARSEQESLQSGALKSHLAYWRKEYSPIPEVLPLLPMAKGIVRPETQRVETVHASRVIDEDMVVAVKQACQVLGTTAFQFYLAVVQILLAQSLNLEDLCIGVADANRPNADFMDTVGFFLNLLPVRFNVHSSSTFAQVAQNTARQMGTAFEKSVPLDILLDELNIRRSSSHTPLFQVLVNYRLAMTKSIPFGNSSLTIIDGEEGRNPYDITFSFLESQSEGLGVTMDCLESLYGVHGTERIIDMYMHLLKQLVHNVNTTVSECQIYDSEAISTALKLGQCEKKETGWLSTVSEKVQTICNSFPEKIAIRDRSFELTYQQLTSRVHSIAGALRDVGQGTGSRIAVLCEPSNDLIASLLAILHIGATYIPLDVSLPASPHAEIISSAQPSVIICDESTSDAAKELAPGIQGNVPVLSLETVRTVNELVPCAAQPNSAAFILYTSGTTGKPKGVVLCQASVTNWLAHAIGEYGLDTAPAPILQQSSLGFDMSLIQIFCALCSGGTLVIVPQESRRDPSEITRLIKENLRLAEGCTGWRLAWLGGEPFPVQFKREIQRLELPNLTVFNGYGPTEVTFTATSKSVSLDTEEKSDFGSPIGKPQPNYSICILDAKSQPLPVGFRGEICIGGAGVALGYWDMSVETDQKFIPDPTKGSVDGSVATGKWYRTGDQGCLKPDGSVIFLGRLGGDTQVKVRGQRIELAEVEGALLESGESLLSTAVVTFRDGDLIAHVIPNAEKEIDHDLLQRKLLTDLDLPQYMHPARFFIVNELPRANSGKIDRQAVMNLPLAGRSETSGGSTSELSFREVELKLLWSRVLPDPYQVLTAESDFFLEGGSSLRLTKLQNEIKETLGVSVSTRELYSAPTLREMAARIGSESAQDLDIDWSIETAIPENLILASKQTSKRARIPTKDALKVLLTGAASVLGNSILHALIQDTAVDQVHCIAVSPDDEERILISDKVIAYPGNLSSSDLGLSPSELATLQLNMDVVIHAGANGHCLNSYSSIRRPNVESTHFLAGLCTPRSIPLLYVSSQRVPALAGLNVLPPVPVLAEPAKTGDTGYMASRWVSERFFHKFSEYNHFMTEIHRPCLFFGDRAPPTDALNGVLRYTQLMKCIPRFTRVQGYVDVKNVDIIAHDIVLSAILLAGDTSTGIRFRHHSSGRKVTLDEWPTYMQELYGEPFEVLELADWIDRARKAGIHPLIATYMEGVIEKEELALFPYLGGSM
ncbi:polyketide synthase [Penicillium malachiteum]|uniref:polyketide synthase n=1 Tax=Penicillium malachiteum TaxID=1324776 RepID=UPI002546AB33|nr:polyketide synthase [Penicillium malachiteum]KAJ5726765.1 polyketide synthase [Penicillium malachiteum]